MTRREAAPKGRYSILAVGASWGGVEALSQLVATIPAEVEYANRYRAASACTLWYGS